MPRPWIDEARDLHRPPSREPGRVPPTVEDWMRDHEHYMRREAIESGRVGELVVHRGGTRVARVEANRWMTECGEECGSGVAIWWLEDGTGLALCYECGAIHDIAPLENKAEIEAALLKRPVPFTRKYDPGETPADLESQNRERGID